MRFLKQLLFVLLFCSTKLFAQLTSGSIAPNFTLTDIDGNTHELYDYLDDGKSVLLDIFAVWCGPCQTHAPALEQAYQAYGPNGDDSMVFLALEDDWSTTDAQCENYNGFPWSSIITYPIINTTTTISSNYNVNYYPTIYMICPDKIISEVGQVDIAGIGAYLDANCEFELPENDLKIEGLQLGLSNCTSSAEPNLELKNSGTNIMSYPSVDVYLDETFVETIIWQGAIPPGETISVALSPLLNLAIGTHTLKMEISEDDVINNNEIVESFTINQFSSDAINFNLVLDNYPSETSWELLNESAEVVYSGSGYSNANSSISETFILSSEECYTFVINDTYGDGICCSHGSGSYTLSNDEYSITGGEFEFLENISFYIGEQTNQIVSSQLIQLPTGWSIFSTYMLPSNTDFANVLSEVASEVTIAKNYLGAAYLPDWGFNGIGDVQFSQGYQIKTKNPCEITVDGSYLYPQLNPLILVSGWNIISYLRLDPAPANLVFEDLNAQGKLVIVKDASGAAYLPSWDFNGIGDLEPGKGYQVKTSSAAQLIYLSNLESY